MGRMDKEQDAKFTIAKLKPLSSGFSHFKIVQNITFQAKLPIYCVFQTHTVWL